MDNKLYDILGVDRSASLDDIKTKYKTLAKKYHPDRNNNNQECKQKFQEIVHAFEVLSNKEKREIYDNYGEQGLNSDNDSDPMSDLFRHMNQNRNVTAKMEYVIDLETYFRNKVVKVEIPRDIKCDTCSATGFSDKQSHFCKQCKGTGVVSIVRQIGPGFLQQMQHTCSLCLGVKYDTTLKNLHCNDCCGKGFKSIKENLDVEIPQNIIDNPITIVPNRGPWNNDRYIDVAIIFKLRLSDGFKITNDKNLIYTMNISLSDSICGFTKTFNHPNGKKLSIFADEGYIINPNNIYKLDNFGLIADNNSYMYLAFVIKYPTSIKVSNKKMLTYSTLRETLGGQVTKKSEKKNNIINLSTLQFINNFEFNNDNDEMEHEFANGHEQSCNQQ